MNISFEELVENPKRLQVFEGVRVTPSLARKLLELNTSNRPLSAKRVKAFSEQMTKGNWRFTGDTLKISKTKKLLDGQYRLSSIVESNTSQTYNIQIGLPDEVFDVLDTGKNRNASDIMAIAGYPLYGILSGAIKLVISYDKNKLGLIHGARASTNRDVSEWPERHDMKLMQECAQMGSHLYNTGIRVFAPSTYAGFLYLFARKNKDMAFSFFNKLASGEDISFLRDSSIYLLREKLISMLTSPKLNRYTQQEKYALLIKAWNAYRNKDDIRRLSWRDDERFPRIS